MLVIKRNGTTQEFSWDKIYNVISKAFQAVNKPFNNDIYESILDELYFGDENGKLRESITVEELQDQIEQALYECDHFDVMKAFILYRNQHYVDRINAEADIKFIQDFVNSDNTANATIDDNSNVSAHGIGVLNAEMHKRHNQNTNMKLWEMAVNKLYPEISIKQMREDLNTILYAHDSSSQVLMPYCMAVSMYPFLTDGLKELGGKSAVPKSLESFCGIYINLLFALASEVKGAVATPEFLMYFDYFARKEWGEHYYQYFDKPAKVRYTNDGNECCAISIDKQIEQYFQQVTYSINQVASSRGMQSPFTNFSFFDEFFFNGMFGDFCFPDGTKPVWESVNWIQQKYLHWLNQERLQCMLTFPVCSYAVLVENGEFKDQDTFHYICREYAEGNSFFLYLSESVDSLSSCCRLQNAVAENTFNFTNGQIGVMTGSKNVVTLNLNRIIQDFFKRYPSQPELTIEECAILWKGDVVKSDFISYLISILDRVYKYQAAYNKLLHWANDNGLYNAYKAGFINLDKQYLTIGINALNQAAEFVGIKCNNNSDYQEFCLLIFGTIKEQNKLHKTAKTMFNCEQVPAESASIKLYNRDKRDGYWVPEDTNLYASYIFKPNDTEISVLDKITLHSSKFASDKLDGGSACHINLEEHLSEKQYEKVLKFAANEGCKYMTFNIPNSECDNCGFITKVPIKQCPKCSSYRIALWDRIIG